MYCICYVQPQDGEAEYEGNYGQWRCSIDLNYEKDRPTIRRPSNHFDLNLQVSELVVFSTETMSESSFWSVGYGVNEARARDRGAPYWG
jgi:hypothetical protein